MYEEHQRKEIKCIKKILSLLPILSMFPLCTHISHSLICWIKKKTKNRFQICKQQHLLFFCLRTLQKLNSVL